MAGTSPRNVAFSKVLYCVPLIDDNGDAIPGAVIDPDVLSGQQSFSNVVGDADTGGDAVGSLATVGPLQNAGATAGRTAGTYVITDSGTGGTTKATANVVVAADGSATVQYISFGAGYAASDNIIFSRVGTYGGSSNITQSVTAVTEVGGISRTQRWFYPACAGRTDEARLNDASVDTAGGFDFGNASQNRLADRSQCLTMAGTNRDDVDTDTTLETIAFGVYAPFQ